jgi:hypothetical protein
MIPRLNFDRAFTNQAIPNQSNSTEVHTDATGVKQTRPHFSHSDVCTSLQLLNSQQANMIENDATQEAQRTLDGPKQSSGLMNERDQKYKTLDY